MVIREVAKHPGANRSHDEPEREEEGGVQLLNNRIGPRKKRSREIELEGGVRVEVVVFDQVTD